MKTQSINSGQFVRGADGALYRVTKLGAVSVPDQAAAEPVVFDRFADGMPAWSDLDNSSARTFIAPTGH